MIFNTGDEVVILNRRTWLKRKLTKGNWEVDPPVAANRLWNESEMTYAPIRLMGQRSPFWECPYCQAMATSPLGFKHKPGCKTSEKHGVSSAAKL